jgi:hypothetical protein
MGKVQRDRQRATRGQWIWIASAVATSVVVVAVATMAASVPYRHRHGGGPFLNTSIRTAGFQQRITALSVHDYGGPIQVSAGRAGDVQVTEVVSYNGAPPQVEQSVANGQLTLADPACNPGRCSVRFQVTAPAATTARLDSDGGAITVAGLTRPTAADSGGGPVIARSVTGPLNAETGGGALDVRDESGPLSAETGGGPADVSGIAARDVTVSTGGGGAQLAFAVIPRQVEADSGGGPVIVQLPGGSYAVTADSAGGPQRVAVATDPASPDTISVSSGGGAVSIG